jgi:phosphate transport system substrate-binding protein
MKVSKLAKAAVIALALGLVASTPASAASLQGSGASFPANLIEACKAPFAAATTHSYTYASSSSGTGQSNSTAKIGDFWFSDDPFTASTRRSTLIHAPIVAGPIAVMHNLPGSKTLQLSASTIAKIFAGEVTMWNDPAIAADNNRSTTAVVYAKNSDGTLKKDSKGDPIVLRTTPVKATGIFLPARKIQVVYRNDSSGTVANFTNYLYASAPSVWKKAGNKVFTTTFPGDINSADNLGRIVGAKSSSGAALQASKTPYSITFAEVSYAKDYKLKVANVINNAGSSVAPDSTGVSAFLSQATMDSQGIMTYDFKTTEKGAYPLGIVSYLLADTSYDSPSQAAAVKAFATFILSSDCATTLGAPLGFATLTGELLKKAQAQVAKIG